MEAEGPGLKSCQISRQFVFSMSKSHQKSHHVSRLIKTLAFVYPPLGSVNAQSLAAAPREFDMHITSILGIDRKLHEDCYIIIILLDCRRTAIINSLKYFIFLIIFYYMFVGNLFLLRLGFFLYCILNLVLISYFSIYIYL